MKTMTWMIVAALGLLCAGCANKNTAGYGPQTRAWMAQQKSSQNQAPPQGMTGEAADRAYQRYLQSFTRPIPDKFERERAGGEGQK
jgi:hypothetical protein